LRIFRTLAPIVLACLPSLAHAADAYYFFGDSLTAEGTFQSAPIMWPSVLQADTSVFQGADFAVSGSTTAAYLAQVNSFLTSGDKVTSNTVAAIWIETNNITIGSAQNQPAQLIVQNALSNIVTGIQELVSTGVKNFIVLGVYDLSLTNALGTNVPARTEAAVAAQLLNGQLATLKVQGANIQYFDIAAFINQMQMHPQQYGFLQIMPLAVGATATRCVSRPRFMPIRFIFRPRRRH